jgi:hypothetical protein
MATTREIAERVYCCPEVKALSPFANITVGDLEVIVKAALELAPQIAKDEDNATA